jgi:putative copper export protein
VITGLVRGVLLLGLASAIGGLAIELLLPASSAPDTDDARARLRRWGTTCLVLVALATWVELLVRAQAMSGAPLGATVAALPSFVTGTHVGQVLAARGAALVVALLLWSEHARGFRTFVLLLAVGMALSISLTGHAADRGGQTLGVAVDWVHAVAACAWIGGLVALALVIGRGGAAWPRETLDAVLPRFWRLARLCLLIVVLTGSYNAWTQLGGVSRLWTTTYGQVLLAKLLLVAGLLVVGRRRQALSASPESRLSAFITAEALLGVAVFACAAVLGELTPGRRVTFDRRTPPPVASPAPPDAAGPRADTARPLHGDAARGRAVFARLECAGCHAVPDPSFSAPTRPGPDLAGIGARSPSEIVEAIMNPNAKILEGPGYTDERGLSIMPDHSARLTADELSDLVEYLRSFDGARAPSGSGPPSGSAPPVGSEPPAGSAPPTTEPPAGERSAEPR